MVLSYPMPNTLGDMNCIDRDSSKCVFDHVSMLDNESGDFGADFSDPAFLKDSDHETFKQLLMNNNYKGG